MGCYADADFAGLWGHENHQDHIFGRTRTGYVATFTNCILLWKSKIHTEIYLSTLHSVYVSLYCSVRALLPLKSITKEVIENLGIDSENLRFVSSFTIYEDNNGSMVVATSPRMTPTSKHISVKYYWFRQHVGKEFVIRKIKADISTKGLQGQICVRISRFIFGW